MAADFIIIIITIIYGLELKGIHDIWTIAVLHHTIIQLWWDTIRT